MNEEIGNLNEHLIEKIELRNKILERNEIILEQLDEIERLNNIITELEKYIEKSKYLASGVEELKGYAYMFYYNKTDDLQNKIKELKENK